MHIQFNAQDRYIFFHPSSHKRFHFNAGPATLFGINANFLRFTKLAYNNPRISYLRYIGNICFQIHGTALTIVHNYSITNFIFNFQFFISFKYLTVHCDSTVYITTVIIVLSRHAWYILYIMKLLIQVYTVVFTTHLSRKKGQNYLFFLLLLSRTCTDKKSCIYIYIYILFKKRKT